MKPKHGYSMNNKQGFTLLELIVGMAVFSVISLMLISIFTLGIKNNKQVRLRQESNDSIQLVYNSLENDIREGSQLIQLSTEENSYHLNDMLNENIITYTLNNEVLYKNGVYLIDQIKSFEIEELGDLNELKGHEIYEGLKIILSITEETIYDYKIYFRH